MFKEDLERTYKHIQTRTKVLQEKAKGKQSGVNLEPVGNKMEVFRGLPSALQQALLTENMEKVDAALNEMSESDKAKWLKSCNDAGILQDPSESASNEERLALFKELPEDFGKSLLSGDLDTANDLLAGYPQEEAERVLDICKRGGFLDIQEEEEDEGAEAEIAESSQEQKSQHEEDSAAEIPNVSV
jgi:cell division cycle protein 37